MTHIFCEVADAVLLAPGFDVFTATIYIHIRLFAPTDALRHFQVQFQVRLPPANAPRKECVIAVGHFRFSISSNVLIVEYKFC